MTRINEVWDYSLSFLDNYYDVEGLLLDEKKLVCNNFI
jgi:hypothetical protein